MTEVHCSARDRGLPRVELCFHDFGQPALRLYEGLGSSTDRPPPVAVAQISVRCCALSS